MARVRPTDDNDRDVYVGKECFKLGEWTETDIPVSKLMSIGLFEIEGADNEKKKSPKNRR